MENAQQAGAKYFRDLQKLGKSKQKRNLTRRMLKGSKWPKPYWAKVRTWDPKLEKEVKSWVPILLPHELLGTLRVTTSNATMLFSRENMDPKTLEHLVQAEQQMGCQSDEVLGVGMWLDSVPCNCGDVVLRNF